MKTRIITETTCIFRFAIRLLFVALINQLRCQKRWKDAMIEKIWRIYCFICRIATKEVLSLNWSVHELAKISVIISWMMILLLSSKYQEKIKKYKFFFFFIKCMQFMTMTLFRRCFFYFYFFIKCMQSMTMTLSRRCMYAKLHVIWSKSLLYIFSLVNHIDSLRIQALFLNPRHRTFVFLCSFALFAFYSFVSNSHFLVAIRVFFKYSSVAILSILMMNSVNIVSVFLSWAFSLSFICSAL